MRATKLPERKWYQTEDGSWASRLKSEEDQLDDGKLLDTLGAEVNVNGFGGLTVSKQRSVDALRTLYGRSSKPA
jgi:hypothetical protein